MIKDLIVALIIKESIMEIRGSQNVTLKLNDNQADRIYNRLLEAGCLKEDVQEEPHEALERLLKDAGATISNASGEKASKE